MITYSTGKLNILKFIVAFGHSRVIGWEYKASCIFLLSDNEKKVGSVTIVQSI